MYLIHPQIEQIL